MFVQEAYSLAELAKVVDRPQSLSDMLTARAQAMAKKISDNLWDEKKLIFVNRYSADHGGDFSSACDICACTCCACIGVPAQERAASAAV